MRLLHVLTFGEEACEPVAQVSAEEPAIAKVVVSFDELDAIALGQAQLVGTAGDEVVCTRTQRQSQQACSSSMSVLSSPRAVSAARDSECGPFLLFHGDAKCGSAHRAARITMAGCCPPPSQVHEWRTSRMYFS